MSAILFVWGRGGGGGARNLGLRLNTDYCHALVYICLFVKKVAYYL